MLSPQDQWDLAQLVYRSFWLIDNGQAAESADLFAADASLTFGPGAPMVGTIEGPAIAAAMQARQDQAGVTSRHVLSNPIVSDEGEGRARVRSLLTLFRTPDADLAPVVRSVADIIDDCVRVDGGWRIAARQILPVFSPG